MKRATPEVDRADRWTEEPLGLVGWWSGRLRWCGPLIAVLLAITGADPRALQLVGALWAIYGLTVGFLSGILEPVIDGLLPSWSPISESCGWAAVIPASRLWLPAGICKRPRMPMRSGRGTSLSGSTPRSGAQRSWPVLSVSLRPPPSSSTTCAPAARSRPRDDFRVGLALVELYEHDLKDPGRAMAELRRLIDRYPTAQGARRLRVALAGLKAERFARRQTALLNRPSRMTLETV